MLQLHERGWQSRPLVRRLYTDWFRLAAASLSPRRPIIELGAGISRFNQVVPDTIVTDIALTPWSSTIVDAHQLPYDDASVGNLVLIDVFHHLADPGRFLAEAERVLTPGGRVVILDPYCSAVSTLAYRLGRHERTDLRQDAFADDPSVGESAMASNQARATLAFFRSSDEFSRRFPELRLVGRRRLALFVYPLSGGLTRRPLLPGRLWSAAFRVERLLEPLAPLLAFRCLVVLERG